MDSTCRFCKEPIVFGVFIVGEWSHRHGGSYCQDAGGFTATPIRKAEPVLETEVL